MGIIGNKGITGSKGIFGGASVKPAFTPLSLSPMAGFLASEATASSLPDTTGNGNDLAQATVSKQPNPDLYMLKDNKTIYFNEDQYITTSGDLLNLTQADNSVYAVYQLRNPGGAYFSVIFGGQVSEATKFGCYLENNIDGFGYTHSMSTYRLGSDTTDYDTTSRSVGFRRQGANLKIEYAGREITNNGADSFALDNFYIGGGLLNIHEVWVFNRYLSDEEHQQMMDYCNALATYDVLNDVASVSSFASNGAIFPQWSGSAPNSIYDQASDKTFITWQSTPDMSDLQFSINEYDHSSGVFGTQNDGIATYTYAAANYHGPPSITVDYEGYIHVFGGAHNRSLEHTVSDSPRDISAFTEQTLVNGTYSYPYPVSLGNNIYLFARAQDVDSYDLALRKTATLSGGAATWETEVELATFGASTRFYTGDVIPNGDDIYLIAHYANGGDTIRDNVYLLIYDTVADQIRNIEGNTVVDAVDFPLDSTDLNTNFKIHDTGAGLQCGNVPKMVLIDGAPHVVWVEGEETTDVFACYYMYWDGSSWSTPEKLGMSEGGRFTTQNIYVNSSGSIVVTWPFKYNFTGPSFTRQESIMAREKTGGSFGETKVFLKSGVKPISETNSTFNANGELLITVSEIGDNTSDYDGTLKQYAFGSSGFLS